VRRREFIAGLGGAAATWPLTGRAQQTLLPTIGFLHVGSAKPFAHILAGFLQGLKEAGFIEGQNVAIEYRWAEGQNNRLPELVTELVRNKVAVIIAGGGEPAIFAAKAATTSIPIVFNIGSDPVKLTWPRRES